MRRLTPTIPSLEACDSIFHSPLPQIEIRLWDLPRPRRLGPPQPGAPHLFFRGRLLLTLTVLMLSAAASLRRQLTYVTLAQLWSAGP